MADIKPADDSDSANQDYDADQPAKGGGGNADPDAPDSGEDSVEEELEIARRHADPSKGDKVADGGDLVSVEKGGNPQE